MYTLKIFTVVSLISPSSIHTPPSFSFYPQAAAGLIAELVGDLLDASRVFADGDVREISRFISRVSHALLQHKTSVLQAALNYPESHRLHRQALRLVCQRAQSTDALIDALHAQAESASADLAAAPPPLSVGEAGPLDLSFTAEGDSVALAARPSHLGLPETTSITGTGSSPSAMREHKGGASNVAGGMSGQTLDLGATMLMTSHSVNSDVMDAGDGILPPGQSGLYLEWMNRPQCIDACLVTLMGHEGALLACALGADGETALTAGADGRLIVWDLDSQEERQVLLGHADKVSCCALPMAGHSRQRPAYAVSGSKDKSVRRWDLEAGSGDVTSVVLHTAAKGVTSLCLLEGPDGDPATACVVFGTGDKKVMVHSLSTPGKVVCCLTGHRGSVRSVDALRAPCPDGAEKLHATIVSCDEISCRLWSLPGGLPLLELQGQLNLTACRLVAPLQSGDAALPAMLAVASYKEVHLWPLKFEGKGKAVTGDCRPLRGHTGCIRSLAVCSRRG